MEIHPKQARATATSKRAVNAPFFFFGRSPGATPFFQPKLSVNRPGDVFEKEADCISEKVMRSQPGMANTNISGPGVKTQINTIALKPAMASYSNTNSTPGIEDTLCGNGKALDKATQTFMEGRFQRDFSQVKVHDDHLSHQSAAGIGALAYTHQNHIAFAANQYQPATNAGKQLLAHELTHVVQQSQSPASNVIQRYSDVDHHIVEEVALGSLFSEEDLANIELGNMQRDYSQVGATGNSFLLNKKSDFGGYKAYEHFDHFIFDREKNTWVSHRDYDKIWDESINAWVKRPMPPAGERAPMKTPIQYISEQLTAAVERDIPNANSFIHIGNAFHTIEDFFAHSNFVELTQGDLSAGPELTTHPPGASGPGSETSILSTVSDPASAAFYSEKFKAEQQAGTPVSHGNMAKDFHSHRNQIVSMTLAVLVVREIALMMKKAFELKMKEQRIALVQDTIMPTITSYFMPPGDKNKWWEKILTEDNGNTSRRVKEMQDKTPVTVNQSEGSPLRAFEATKFSSWKAIGFGTSLSIPLKNKTFFTAGYMVSLPGTGTPDDNIFVAPKKDWEQSDKPKIIFGVQVSGSFDVTDWIK